MKILAATILIILLCVPAEAARRRKPRAKGKGRAVRVKIVRDCPPPLIRYVDDSVQVIGQDEEAALQAAIARWMRGQPEMSPEAETKARGVAELWFRRGQETPRR